MTRSRGRRTALVATTVLAAALTLAGCSAGAVTQTDTSLSGAPGTFGNAGQILVRDMTFDAGPQQVTPAGGQVTLKGTIVNQGGTTDRLVSVSTPYAQQVSAEGATTLPGDGAIRVVGSEPGAVGPPRANARETGELRLTLTGVTQVMRPGPTYDVTFQFARSGSVTVPVIVYGAGPAAG